MTDEARPLSDDERAELEALRAEKAAREEREQAARERAELETLRAQRAADLASQQASAQRVEQSRARREAAEEERRIREARERGAKLMEPDDDLRMPLGQKIVIGALVALVIIWVTMTFLLG